MLSEKNKEAVKSSVLVGIAEAFFLAAIAGVNNKDAEAVVAAGVVGFVLGFVVGLTTTWYTEE